MSFISVLVPAFHIKETDENEVVINIFLFIKKKIISEQFEKEIDEFEIIQINKDENMEYAIRFNQMDLSIKNIEELIYQRDCIKSLVEKTFESLKLLTDKQRDFEGGNKKYEDKENQ